MRKEIFILPAIICFLCFQAFDTNDIKPKRFTKPLDEETKEKGEIQKSFIDYVPEFSSSVFINYNISRDSFPQNETSVKISRKDPNRVVAAWRDFRTGVTPANRKVGYSYSTDGGDTWSVSKLLDSTLLPGFPRNSDPVVNTDSAGNFYIAVISLGSTGALAIYKSTDGGVTFPFAYLVADTGSEDKEMMDTDRTPGSPYYNTIYISWTRFSFVRGIKATRSTNGGMNWTAAVPVSDVEFGNQGSDLAVGLDGEVYVTWLDGNTSNNKIEFDKSTNGGVSFGKDTSIAEGKTPDIPISSSGVTFPSIATDISGGQRNGNIYVTWCDSRNGDPDIFITSSTNRGNNWSSPVRVNNDAVGNGKLQCWPWIEVNDSGKIAILFYDSRNTSSNTIIEAYLAHSNDGGLTFTNHNLSTQATPTNQPNTDIRFGDYIQVDYYKNKIVPVWTDERAGGFNMECYTALVTTPVSVNSFSNQLPDRFELKQNYPNPFNPSTVINYSLTENRFVSLKVYNALGKEVAALVNQKQSAGNYQVEFNAANFNTGIYFYKLETESFVETKKMILLK
ncbi:MAG: T9SS type A sorting domain-containing protein [Bacteroidota bacterium]|nr:T9SS type A sorting domain-containing protein [Bacteroidota bacterium]